uniref:sigma-70 family RNA polymerase sigma factor n=1 Tax=Pedobacter schmidteae TaxID=2201271 RepID=UPI000EB079C7|nr:RNA polymerase sigma factor RpoD/SigA [Pedobacter schmidteae]
MKEIKIERSITNRKIDSLARYLQELAAYPLLNGTEETALTKKIRAGDEEALQKLVNCNLRFVVSVAKKYEVSGMPLADLIAEGNIGLLKAAQRFDETRGFKFISYAVWWIRQAMLQSIGMHQRSIRLPLNQLKGISDLSRSADLLEQQLERTPSLEELSAFTQLPAAVVSSYSSSLGHICSLDKAIEDGDQDSFKGSMMDAECIWPDAALEQEALRVNIELMMKGLSLQEQDVIRLAYGLGELMALGNEAIAQRLGISDETVCRTKRKALNRMREMAQIKIMREYL